MDAYGSIEPVDADALENVFNEVVQSPERLLQNTHWASLINAYGCVQKDLNKALATFDSIAAHPLTVRSETILPDAVVFEALLNVLVTWRRMDLVPGYLERLAASGIHMTAYIANLLIKGYAATNDIQRARDIFESLADPPIGVAAPNNHARHPSDNQQGSFVPTDAPIYREVRAILSKYVRCGSPVSL